MSGLPIKIGTRSSNLAVTQAETFAAALIRSVDSYAPELVKLLSSGDKKRDLPEGALRDKKDWVIEFEEALVSGEIDVAIHSAKDVPVEIHPDTEIISIMNRAAVHDCLIIDGEINQTKNPLSLLKQGAVVGTTSPRRKLQLKMLRQDLKFIPLRGNVPTRIEKLRSQSELDCLILALAGIQRLNLNVPGLISLTTDQMLPAVNQGILALQYRKDDKHRSSYRKLTDPLTQYAFTAERAVIAALGADCNSAVGIYAESSGVDIKITARVLGESGECIEAQIVGGVESSYKLADTLAKDLLSKGAKELL